MAAGHQQSGGDLRLNMLGSSCLARLGAGASAGTVCIVTGFHVVSARARTTIGGRGGALYAPDGEVGRARAEVLGGDRSMQAARAWPQA